MGRLSEVTSAPSFFQYHFSIIFIVSISRCFPVQLIERFEEKAYPIPEAPGYRVLRTLMENRGVKQADLLPIFGSRGIASEVYNGKRAISIAASRYHSSLIQCN